VVAGGERGGGVEELRRRGDVAREGLRHGEEDGRGGDFSAVPSPQAGHNDGAQARFRKCGHTRQVGKLRERERLLGRAQSSGFMPDLAHLLISSTHFARHNVFATGCGARLPRVNIRGSHFGGP
jgi:hypothetical protein